MASIVLQLHPPYNPPFLFLYHKKNMLPELPFCKTPKNSRLHHRLSQRTIFFTELCRLLFGFSLSWSELHRENRGKESQNLLASYLFLLSLYLYLFPFSHSFLVLFIVSWLFFLLDFSIFSFSICFLSLAVPFVGSWLVG